ncbi:Type III flagellar switch regulator (C-ring) FliN C-term [Vibrio sp. B1REV9]|uniref:FliM/FliN family flagellar motor switch protein n=1 Tax=Vibrio sp. B1REV9 TaxID=2751179 RepID=UPI001AF71959|nr:flagellar motor switch protein FliM [Vibrio sp. B1REV9]CAE6931673.1 Type III flagellar switch regulator (C-ring) FliN C-term [Vibrio sp. B1REV9]
MESRVKEPIYGIKTLDVELLGKPIHIIRERLESLISESCIYLSNELQNWLSTNKIEAKLHSVDLHRFEPNLMDKEFTSTYQHLEQGKVFLHGDARVLIKLADRFYGASMERSSTKLSASDLRLQERVGQIITNWLAPKNMWCTCEYEAPQGIGLHAELSISFDEFQGTFHIKLDSFFIQTLIEQLELQTDVDLYQPFCRSLESTPVRVNAVLSKKQMALSEVINLKANDILPIDLLNTVPISIGNQSLFTGRVADQDGQLVLIINSDKESQR